MQTLLSPLRIACAGLIFLARAAAADTPPEASSGVSVNVGPLRNTRGVVACRLHTLSEGFPRSAKGTFTQRVKVAGTQARCTFEKLRPGTYAVVVHHDENDNKKFDKNAIGMPVEGYGASNNRTHALSAPSWDDSKFALERGKTRELAINLRY
jgi:uncharacterized protein (DUF2141 family)